LRVVLVLVLFLFSCNSESLISSKNYMQCTEAHQYKEQDSEKYIGYYYWYKFPSLSLCGFYIVNKQTKEIKYNISDYKTCEYEIEDSYSIENAKILNEFKKSFLDEISLVKKDYFRLVTDITLKKEDAQVPLNIILNKTNIVFLEVINVKSNDKLNIRELPSIKSKIQLSLSNNSKSIFTDKNNIDKNINKSWIKVYYFDEKSYEYKSVWAYKKYVKFLNI